MSPTQTVGVWLRSYWPMIVGVSGFLFTTGVLYAQHNAHVASPGHPISIERTRENAVKVQRIGDEQNRRTNTVNKVEQLTEQMTRTEEQVKVLQRDLTTLRAEQREQFQLLRDDLRGR